MGKVKEAAKASSKTANKPDAGASGSRVITRNFTHSHKRLFIIIGAAIAIVILIIIGLLIYHNDHEHPAHTTASNSNELTKQVGQLVDQKQYQAAQNAIQSSPVDRVTKQTLSAAVYLNAGQYDKALAAYQAMAKQSGLTESLAVSIAQTAALAKQPAVSRQYYQQAINLLQQESSAPGVQATITQLQQAMAEVKG